MRSSVGVEVVLQWQCPVVCSMKSTLFEVDHSMLACVS